MNKGHIVSKEKGMGNFQIPSSSIIVIFGASGDLAHKELLTGTFCTLLLKLST